jgi:oligoribonuclease (3'-5' exoribonuclease)
MTPLIILDCETTGLQPDRHTPWEIAWQLAIHDNWILKLVQAESFLVRLTEEEYEMADPAALRVGRFDDRYGGDMRSMDYVAGALQGSCSMVSRLAKTDKVPHLVGAVPSFDHAMLTRWFGWPGFGEGHWHYHLVDVENLIAGKLGIAPPWDSDELTARIGVEPIDEEFRHTAAGDVQWAVLLYAAVYDLTITEWQPEL